MKVKTSELTDHALDWAVANCEGVSLEHGLTDDERYSTNWAQGGPIIEREGIDLHQKRQRSHGLFEWNEVRARMPGAEEVVHEFSRGGRTWTRRFVRIPNKPRINDGKWFARMAVDNHPFGWSPKDFMSDTPLIAAMRRYVASRLGDEVEIPEELMA